MEPTETKSNLQFSDTEDKQHMLQSIIDTWHTCAIQSFQQEAKSMISWHQFLNAFTLGKYQNIKTSTVLEKYKNVFTKIIYSPLAYCLRTLKLDYTKQASYLFKGNGSRLIHVTLAVYEHLKKRTIPPNCCMQIDLRSEHGSIVSDIDAVCNAIDTNIKNNIDNALAERIPPFIVQETIYKRYELIVSEGMQMHLFDATNDSNIPYNMCDVRLAPFNSLNNSVSSFDKLYDNNRQNVINISFQVYNDTIIAYIYVAGANQTLFGSRIFATKNDLLKLIPLLFEDERIEMLDDRVNLKFTPDPIFEQFIKEIRENIHNDGHSDSDKESSSKTIDKYEKLVQQLQKLQNENRKLRRQVQSINERRIEDEIITVIEEHMNNDPYQIKYQTEIDYPMCNAMAYTDINSHKMLSTYTPKMIVNISKSFCKNKISNCFGFNNWAFFGKGSTGNYIQKQINRLVTMTFIDNQLKDDEKIDVLALDFNMFDEKMRKVFLVLEKHNTYQWKIDSKLFLKSLLKQQYLNILIKTTSCISNGVDASFIIKRMKNKIKQLIKDNQVIKTMVNVYNWYDIQIFNHIHHQRQLDFSITNKNFKKRMLSFIHNTKHKLQPILIPIVMFNNNGYFLEIVWRVKLFDNTYIGIGFKAGFKPEIVSIHTCKKYLSQQHQLIEPPHRHITKRCNCFDDWTIQINNLKIENNKILKRVEHDKTIKSCYAYK